jgi:hypothetical protein
MHPIFDRPGYPWDRPEAIELHRVLRVGITVPARIELLYRKYSPPDAPGLSSPASADVMWQEALQNMHAEGVLRTFAHGLLKDYRRNAAVVAAVTAVLNAEPRVDQLTVTDDGSLVILDRKKLRQFTKQLASPMSPLKVILVRGDSSSGKSHGRYLFDLSATDENAQSVYICDGMVGALDDVVRELFGALNAQSKIPPVDETDSGYHAKVWSTLREVAPRPGRRPTPYP